MEKQLQEEKGVIKGTKHRVKLVGSIIQVAKIISKPFIGVGKFVYDVLAEASNGISDEDKMDSIDSYNMDFMDND